VCTKIRIITLKIVYQPVKNGNTLAKAVVSFDASSLHIYLVELTIVKIYKIRRIFFIMNSLVDFSLFKI